ncbi:TRAP transporter small permease [Aquibacillus sediminis]|uniref:TRAP transporter small permease n=1 Tax=Aquibacillus sediminis TaxID=2574734 RepID=UPI00110985D8|nr:TRAP transporter small permease [Aquibacillus sediminis]
MKFIITISNAVYKVEQVMAVILLSIMTVSLTAGVIFRYFLNNPLMWSGEVGVFSLIWLTFIGGSMTIKKKKSARLTILVDNLKGSLKKMVERLCYLIVLVFVAYFLYIIVHWIQTPSILQQRSSSMQIKMIYPYLSIVISFLFMTIHSLSLLVESFYTKEM